VAASRRCASANERLRAAVLSSRLDDSRLAVLFNSRVCPPRFSAGGAADASLRPARVLVFVAPVRVRAPRLVPFALDCPRIICRRPDAQCGPRRIYHTFPQRPIGCKGASDALSSRDAVSQRSVTRVTRGLPQFVLTSVFVLLAG
jgi:hypothetical protein